MIERKVTEHLLPAELRGGDEIFPHDPVERIPVEVPAVCADAENPNKALASPVRIFWMMQISPELAALFYRAAEREGIRVEQYFQDMLNRVAFQTVVERLRLLERYEAAERQGAGGSQD